MSRRGAGCILGRGDQECIEINEQLEMMMGAAHAVLPRSFARSFLKPGPKTRAAGTNLPTTRGKRGSAAMQGMRQARTVCARARMRPRIAASRRGGDDDDGGRPAEAGLPFTPNQPPRPRLRQPQTHPQKQTCEPYFSRLRSYNRRERLRRNSAVTPAAAAASTTQARLFCRR